MAVPPSLPQPPQPQPPQPTAPKTVYVNFLAEINPKTAESLLAVMANCVNQKVETVHLAISTPGGEVSAGIAIYNALRAMPFRLITHNIGNVDSIGNAIFLAGSTRYACKHSTFMFHGVGFLLANQNIRLEEKNTKEMLQNLLADQLRIGAILQERTRIPAGTIPELFREAQTKDSDFAVSNGIVEEVRDFQIPPGSSVVSLVFQR